jgi:hypothetical protein
MRRWRFQVLMLAVLVVPSGDVSAQLLRWQAPPLYGTINLVDGFLPDPHTVRITAGGDTRVPAGLGDDCVGLVNAERPDVDVNFTAGSMPLYIVVRSRADTTLVVNAPDGRWYCNDDLDGLDPIVVFRRPLSGNYNIWVGTFQDGILPEAEVTFTQLRPAMRN